MHLLVLLLVIVGVLMAGAGLAASMIPVDMRLPLAMGGVALVAVAWRIDRRRETRAARRMAARDDARRDAGKLTLDRWIADPWATGATLDVRQGIFGFGAATASVVIGALLAVAFNPRWSDGWPGFLGGTGVMLLGALGLARAVPALGRPALTLSTRGIRVPLNGWVGWRMVEGVARIDRRDRRGRLVGSALALRLHDAGRAVERVHWTDRVLGWLHLGLLGRQVLVTPGFPPEAEPEAVEAMARHLWHGATGRKTFWYPGMSESDFQRGKRFDAGIAALAATAPVADAVAVERQVAALAHDTEMLTQHIRKTAARSRIAMWALVVLSLAVTAFALVHDGF